MNPDEYPFGQTEYKNYDPEQINSVGDAAEVFEWISKQNRERDKSVAASAFQEAADLLRECDL